MKSLHNILESTIDDLKSGANGHAPLHDLLEIIRESDQNDWPENESGFAYLIAQWIGSYNKSLAGFVPPSVSKEVYHIRRNLVQESFIPSLSAYINNEISEWECFIAIKTKYGEALNAFAALLQTR